MRNNSKNRASLKSQNIIQRTFLFFAVLCVSVASTFAQDVITLKNGDDIQALVQEIGEVDVKYKKFDNPNGPNYILKKSEMLLIRYKNGTKDIFNESVNNTLEKGETADPCIEINGVKWATRNVGKRGAFVANPEDDGNFYTWNEAQNVCPSGFRLPTIKEMQSLHGCPFRWTTRNGVNGTEFVSGESTLFFPACGYRNRTGSVKHKGRTGYYWSSSQYSFTGARYIWVNNNGVTSTQNTLHYFGHCIRCVAE